jgi:hypothetical protein
LKPNQHALHRLHARIVQQVVNAAARRLFGLLAKRFEPCILDRLYEWLPFGLTGFRFTDESDRGIVDIAFRGHQQQGCCCRAVMEEFTASRETRCRLSKALLDDLTTRAITRPPQVSKHSQSFWSRVLVLLSGQGVGLTQCFASGPLQALSFCYMALSLCWHR